MNEDNSRLWKNPVWQQKAHEWIRSKAKCNSIQLKGEIKHPHVRHWSTVMEVDSNQGKLFFKATAPEINHEIALTEMLAVWYPADMVELLAVDRAQGWLLMRDGGEQLRTSIRPMKNLQPWEPAIQRYAELQIGLSKHVDEMLELGIPDHRLGIMPSLFYEVLADEESLLLGQEKGLSVEEFQQCKECRSQFEDVCAQLADFGVPETLNHGDFHDANVLIKDGQITFFDWGDADITHPFVSLRTFLVSLEMSLELNEYEVTPEMVALLDIYMKPFEKYAAKDKLQQSFRLSKPVASIIKTLAWKENITRMNEPMRSEYKMIVPELLREFLYHMSPFSGQA